MNSGITIEPLTMEAVRELLSPRTPPCLSLYQPTHRNVPGNAVDQPTFRTLVESLERPLAAARSGDHVERLLRPFRALAADATFWRHTRHGLAVLAADGGARVFLLQTPVAPSAGVADRFHTMPLVRAATALERFHVLALTSRSARVWTGCIWHDPSGDGSDRLDPVPLVPVPGGEPVEALTRPDVISPESFEPHRVKHGLGSAGFVHGGYGARRDDVERDTVIFLRHVDAVVHEQVSRPAELPVVLVAPGRLAAAFRGLSRNPLVLDEHVDIDPHLLSADELGDLVVPVFSQARRVRIDREVAAFAEARGHGLGSGDLAEVARAAVAGRVATLLVEADRREIGRFDRGTGAVEFAGFGGRGPAAQGPPAAGEDVVAAVAEIVLATGATVVTLARIAMPTESGVAAIYRYA